MRGSRWVIIVVFSVLTLVTSGCSKREADVEGKAPRIQVSYWGSYEEVNIIESIMHRWQRENPQVKVELQHTPGVSNYTNKLLTRILGGAPPDVAFAEVEIFVDFVSHDLFLDLKPFIDNDPDFNLDDFFPDVVARFTREGKIYGIPRDTAPLACVYYNKRLFDEAGVAYPRDDWDWNELLEKAKALTKKDEQGRIVQYAFYTYPGFYQNFVYSNGGGLVDNVDYPKKCMLDTPEAIEGLQFFADLCTKYKVSPDPGSIAGSGKTASQLFMTGRVAMYNSGIWETPQLRHIKEFDWDIVMFPKGPKGKRAFGTGGSAYCILKRTKNPQAAWDVIKALAGKEGQIMMAEKGLAQPANIKIAEGLHWAGDPKKPLNKGMLNEAVQYAIYPPFHPKWREINEKYIDPQLDYLLLGKITVAEFIEEVSPKIDKMLQEKD